MKWAALVLWVITASGGFVLLGVWLKNGGMAQSDKPGRRIRPPLLFSHFLLAATGLVLWIIYVAGDNDTIGWIAFVLLAIVALLGFTMLGIWLQRRSARQPAAVGIADDQGQPAEQRFPVPVVVLHGLVAAATLVLVLLTDAGVGSS